ncbi:hypothetical protein [Paenibacillus xylaniclasticus]|uniref:hypothetical protein n=1 Tax=Paenibacillus xylaniclasticus TaxID=588083 RepID=UPI000FD9351A|nr:hypothetical protein [Paenibacillus xylaniclasticus]
MGINVSHASSQASDMSDCASTLRDLANSLSQYKAEMNQNWQADGVMKASYAFDRIIMSLQGASSQLSSLSSDIVSVAYEIRREEEEAERRAAAAAAAAAAQAEAAKNNSSSSKNQWSLWGSFF